MILAVPNKLPWDVTGILTNFGQISIPESLVLDTSSYTSLTVGWNGDYTGPATDGSDRLSNLENGRQITQ